MQGIEGFNTMEPKPVTVINSRTFTIEGAEELAGEYAGGGTVLQVKQPVVLSFKR